MKFFKKLVFRVYVLLLMAFTVWYGYFMYPLIFGFEGKEEAEASLMDLGKAGTEEEKLFVKLIASKAEKTTIDLGYRVIEQPYIEGRFHHIGFEIEEDKTSSCIECHGDIPHNKSKEIRSFLNMHAFYTACQTCHIRSADQAAPLTFRWLDKVSGEQAVNPRALVDIEDSYAHGDETYFPTYGDYGAKIAPGEVSDNTFTFIKGIQDEVLENFLEKQHKLTTKQKSQMNEVIHKRISKEPIACDECHNQTDPHISFRELGYPPRRVEELTASSVVGMIEKYKEFFIPDFISPIPME
ncbi:MAG: hypothetical protein QNJ78_05380 [Gammaproteobacteria bacterium]|nr:hypothetical protein [Gammaproteobacteria bacterium]